MKILIPSNDCLTIAPDFDNAKFFRFLTIVNGSIKNDTFHSAPIELGENSIFDKEKSEFNSISYCCISNNRISGNPDNSDQRIVIAISISRETEKNLQTMNWEVLFTKEANIFNALSQYLKNMVIPDSDYCCCP